MLSFSLYNFKDVYQPLIFKEEKIIPDHIAYICPLCAANYILVLDNRVYSNSDFSLDHFPPESVGGTLKILTCKKCNNDAGRMFEGELFEKMNYESSKNKNPNALIKTKFKVSDIPGNYAGFIKKEKDGEFIIDFPAKAKKTTPFLQTWLNNASMNNDWEATLTIKRPDDKKILKAVLKAAYLICFINWGYDFIFSANGNLIREVLNGTKEYPTNTLSYWLDKNSPVINQIPTGLCLIEKPLEMHSYIVNVPLEINGYYSIASILIPLCNDESWNKLKDIVDFQKGNESIDVAFKQIIAPLLNNIFDGYTNPKL
jgi:hypothetical protein